MSSGFMRSGWSSCEGKGKEKAHTEQVLEMPCHFNNTHTQTQNKYGERKGIKSKNEDGI